MTTSSFLAEVFNIFSIEWEDKNDFGIKESSLTPFLLLETKKSLLKLCYKVSELLLFFKRNWVIYGGIVTFCNFEVDELKILE